jgi:hypothetical protein
MITVIIEPRRTLNLKQAITDAIESGDYTGLHDDIHSCFMEDQIEEIETVLETVDLGEAIDDVISEWGGDDMEELLVAIETYFEERGVRIEFDEDEGLLDEEDEMDLDAYEGDEPEIEDDVLDNEEI